MLFSLYFCFCFCFVYPPHYFKNVLFIIFKLDNVTERYNEIKKDSVAQSQEYERLRQKNAEFSSNIVRLQQTLDVKETDLLQAREELRLSKASADNIKKERDLLVASEQRLVKEVEALKLEQRSQNTIVANLQMLQNEMRRADNDNKTRLEEQIDSGKVRLHRRY